MLVEFEKELKLINFLPAIYQAQAQEGHGLLGGLLAILEHHFAELAQRLDRIEENFNPYATSAEPDPNGRDFLTWLASWVSLDLDAQWSLGLDAQREEKKKRFLLDGAAELYRYRGTVAGLKSMLEQFFGIEVKIEEWAWPDGMQIGQHSTLGIDSWLVEKINRDNCFTVNWKPPDLNQDRLNHLVRKIRVLIDREKPAHTRCYLNLIVPEEKQEKLPPLVIGIESKLGFCVIRYGEDNNARGISKNQS